MAILSHFISVSNHHTRTGESALWQPLGVQWRSRVSLPDYWLQVTVANPGPGRRLCTFTPPVIENTLHVGCLLIYTQLNWINQLIN